MLKTISWEDFVKISSPQYYVLLVTSAEGQTNITGISWFSIVSWSPPLVMLSIGGSRYGYELLKKNPEFVICLPAKAQEKSAVLCGQKSGRTSDKVKEGAFTLNTALKIKAPLIENSTACIECRLEKEMAAGDHMLVAAKVLACHGDFDRAAHVYTTSYSEFYALDFTGKP